MGRTMPTAPAAVGGLLLVGVGLFLVAGGTNARSRVASEAPAPSLLPACYFENDPDAVGRVRSLEFVNECPGDLYVNIQGYTWLEPAEFLKHQIPGGGGFYLSAGQSVTETISERLFSGRIWARPNCTSPCDPLSCGPNGTMWCDTGNCPGAANETTCRGAQGQFIGGLPPGPVAELTLCGGRGATPVCYKGHPAFSEAACNNMPFNDFYDSSNVDGTSRVWIKLEALNGTKITGPGAPADKYNCGAPLMKEPFDFAECPQPLRIARDDTNAFGFTLNASLDETIGCLSACAFMVLGGSGYIADRTLSGGNRNASEANVSAVTAADIAAACCECGHGEDNGLCPAPYPNGTWPPPNTDCIAGCSPFGAYPADYAVSQCSLAKMPTILSAEGNVKLAQVQALFKSWAPDAYSWQFDDLQSTYTCANADYRLTFCPGSDPGDE